MTRIYPDRWRLAAFKAISVFFLTAVSLHAQAQSIPILNPSFDGPVGTNTLPAPWYPRYGTPDTEPRPRNEQLIQPSDGKTYAAIWWGSITPSEAIGYPLPRQLDSGKTYIVSFDLAMLSGYSGFNINFAALQIEGCTDRNEPGEILWRSGAFYHKTWQRYTAIFTPTRNCMFLSFKNDNPGNDTAFIAATFIDNFSDITETLTLDVTAKNACPGQSNGILAVKVRNPGSNYTYLWQPGNYTTSTVTGLPPGKYTVLVKNSDGLAASQEAEIKIAALNLAPAVKNLNCYGDKDFYLDIAATGGQEPYRYFLSDDTAGQDSSIFRNIVTGNYNISVEDAQGCSVSASVTVQEPTPLLLNNVVTKATSCSSSQNGEILLTPEGGVPPYTYRMPAYNKSQSDGIFRQLDAGIYHYQVSDKNNCTIEGDVKITQQSRGCSVIIPNAFSPNGDGLNEYFRPKVMDDVSGYRMAVYGRWGRLVFETTSPEQGWDGKLQGTALPAGYYTWMVTYKNSSHRSIQQKGSVLLIR